MWEKEKTQGDSKEFILCKWKHFELSSVAMGKARLKLILRCVWDRHFGRNTEAVAGYARLESGEKLELEIRERLCSFYIQRSGGKGKNQPQGLKKSLLWKQEGRVQGPGRRGSLQGVISCVPVEDWEVTTGFSNLKVIPDWQEHFQWWGKVFHGVIWEQAACHIYNPRHRNRIVIGDTIFQSGE